MNKTDTIRVQVNPDKALDGKPLAVRNPITCDFYPAGVFDLPAADLKNVDVLRLFPRPGLPAGVAGGVFADLVMVGPAIPAASTSPKKKV